MGFRVKGRGGVALKTTIFLMSPFNSHNLQDFHLVFILVHQIKSCETPAYVEPIESFPSISKLFFIPSPASWIGIFTQLFEVLSYYFSAFLGKTDDIFQGISINQDFPTHLFQLNKVSPLFYTVHLLKKTGLFVFLNHFL